MPHDVNGSVIKKGDRVNLPCVVKEVNALSQVNFRRNELRALKMAIHAVFRTQYKQIFWKAWQESDKGGMNTNPEWLVNVDLQWKQACKQFDDTNELISLFLCRHFTLYREHWTPLLAEYADLSMYHKHFTTKGLAPSRPMPLE